MTIFALGYLGWRDERNRIRAARRHDVINAVCAVLSVAAGVYGVFMAVGP